MSWNTISKNAVDGMWKAGLTSGHIKKFIPIELLGRSDSRLKNELYRVKLSPLNTTNEHCKTVMQILDQNGESRWLHWKQS